jgi:hypothetical protein
MTGALSLLDIGQLIGPKGDFMRDVVDTLRTSSEFSEDGIWVESNAFGKHVTPRWNSEISGEDRIANRGIPASKGSIGAIEDTIAFIESASIVDDFVIRHVPEGNKQFARSEYDVAHTRGLGKTQRTYSFYGDNGINQNQPDGLATRRPTLATNYVYNGAMSGAKNTSLYIVGWDAKYGVHHIYPTGSQIGISMTDMGQQVIIDPDNVDVNRWLPLWVSWFYMDFGLVVRNEKALARVCNIDPDSVTDADYEKVYSLINSAMRSMDLPRNQLRIYGNADGLAFMDNMALRIPTMNIDKIEIEGDTFYSSFSGTPMRECNEVSSAEAAVV